MEMPEVRDVATEARPVRRPGRLIYYHPNGKGSGTALQLELRLNGADESRYDCFFLEMAHQKSAAAGGNGKRVPATFDWAGKVTLKLDFLDVCRMLTVLGGVRSQLEGNGLYHATADTNTLITLNRAEQGGFFLGISKKRQDGTQVFKGSILLSEAESIGLKAVFESALFFMAFRANLRS